MPSSTLSTSGLSGFDLSMPSTSSLPFTTTIESVSKKRKTDAPANLMNFAVRISADKKQEIDKQIAKAVFATNTSFKCLDNPNVIKAIDMLRPGYKPPSGKTISTTLLEQIYKEEKSKCFGSLSGQSVNMSIDGWSNVHNEPVVCATITTENGQYFIFETIDTSGNPHRGDYLTEIACDLIISCKSKYNCHVKSFVTDNAANMALMRKTITAKLDSIIITYRCSAHLLNLFCKDLEIKDIKQHILQIVKYFRNNHLAM